MRKSRNNAGVNSRLKARYESLLASGNYYEALQVARTLAGRQIDAQSTREVLLTALKAFSPIESQGKTCEGLTQDIIAAYGKDSIEKESADALLEVISSIASLPDRAICLHLFLNFISNAPDPDEIVCKTKKHLATTELELSHFSEALDFAADIIPGGIQLTSDDERVSLYMKILTMWTKSKPEEEAKKQWPSDVLKAFLKFIKAGPDDGCDFGSFGTVMMTHVVETSDEFGVNLMDLPHPLRFLQCLVSLINAQKDAVTEEDKRSLATAGRNLIAGAETMLSNNDPELVPLSKAVSDAFFKEQTQQENQAALNFMSNLLSSLFAGQPNQ